MSALQMRETREAPSQACQLLPSGETRLPKVQEEPAVGSSMGFLPENLSWRGRHVRELEQQRMTERPGAGLVWNSDGRWWSH